MKGVHNDDGHDDVLAYPLSHRGDIDSDLSKAPELYRGDLSDCRRYYGFDSLTLPG